MFEEVVDVDEHPWYNEFGAEYIHVGAVCNLPQWFLVLFASLTLWSHSLAVGVRISRAQLGFRAKAGNSTFAHVELNSRPVALSTYCWLFGSRRRRRLRRHMLISNIDPQQHCVKLADLFGTANLHFNSAIALH